MKYISTTELRTKSSELITDLRSGESVQLIHRSEIVGVIKPTDSKRSLPSLKALQHFLHLASSVHPVPTRTTPAQRERLYRQHLRQKYG